MYHKTLPYRIFSIFNNVFLTILSVLCLLPLYHLLMVSSVRPLLRMQGS